MAKPKNLDHILRELRSIPVALREAAGAEIGVLAQELAGKVASAAPGRRLREATAARPAGNRSRADSRAGQDLAALRAEAELSWVVAVDHFTAPFSEYGTAAHSTARGADRDRGKFQDKGPLHPGARAQPFFWPTIRAQKKPLTAKMRRRLSKAIKASAPIGGSGVKA